MTEEKERYDASPTDLNGLKRRVEQAGTNWTDALMELREETGCPDIATAVKQGWTVEEFWKILAPDTPATEAEEPDPPASPPQRPSHSEAPASFNVRAISPQGFDIQLTLRDDSSTALMKRAKAALKWLADNDFTPKPAYNNRRGDGGNEQGASSGNGPKYCNHKSDGPGFCPNHGKELKRSKHHPGYYCPAKV